MNSKNRVMENTSNLSYIGSMDPTIEVMPDDHKTTNYESKTNNENEKNPEESNPASLINEFPLISEDRTVSEINLKLSECELKNNGENLPPSTISKDLLNPPTNLYNESQLESMEISNSDDCDGLTNINTTVKKNLKLVFFFLSSILFLRFIINPIETDRRKGNLGEIVG